MKKNIITVLWFAFILALSAGQGIMWGKLVSQPASAILSFTCGFVIGFIGTDLYRSKIQWL